MCFIIFINIHSIPEYNECGGALKGFWEITWGYLGTQFEVKVFTFFLYTIPLIIYLSSQTIWPNQCTSYCVKCMFLWINLWIHRLIHLGFLMFLKGLIFSVLLTFSQNIYITMVLVVLSNIRLSFWITFLSRIS